MTDASYRTCLELCPSAACHVQIRAQHNANMIDRSRRGVALRGGMHTSLSCSSVIPALLWDLSCQLPVPCMHPPVLYTAPAPSSQKILLRHRRARWVTHRGRFCFALLCTGQWAVAAHRPQEPAQQPPPLPRPLPQYIQLRSTFQVPTPCAMHA